MTKSILKVYVSTLDMKQKVKTEAAKAYVDSTVFGKCYLNNALEWVER